MISSLEFSTTSLWKTVWIFNAFKSKLHMSVWRWRSQFTHVICGFFQKVSILSSSCCHRNRDADVSAENQVLSERSGNEARVHAKSKPASCANQRFSPAFGISSADVPGAYEKELRKARVKSLFREIPFSLNTYVLLELYHFYNITAGCLQFC